MKLSSNETYRLLLFLLALLLVLLLVDGGLLPLGINVRPLAGLPHVELGSVLLGLLSLPLVQGESLGLLRDSLLLLNGAFFLGLGGLSLRSLLNRSVGWFLALGLEGRHCYGQDTFISNSP